ncbi:MAG: hypothetical protein ACRENB_00520 [Gemmatimonadales bacterium]
MFDLKPISAGAITAALAKAERYRLLNEPSAAESICLDVLAQEPGNQAALVMLLLARTDQLGETMAAGYARARAVLAMLRDPCQRAYHAGVAAERRAKALAGSGGPGSGPMAYAHFREAMERYEEAERLAPPGDDDARLRWNTCARILNADPHLRPPVAAGESYEPALEE